MTEQAIQDSILEHSLRILRLSAGDQAEVEKVLRELERELKLLLQSRDLTAAGKRQIADLIAEADKAIEVGYLRAGAVTDTHTLAIIVAEKTQEIIQDVIPAAVRLPSASTLLSLAQDVLIDGAPSSSWWAKQGEDTAFRFAAQVRQGVVNGETQEQIVSRVRDLFGYKRGNGVIAKARSLVHSSVLNAASVARFETFRKNPTLFKGVRWLSTLDMNACIQCSALDGQAWTFEGVKLKGTTIDFRLPLAHWNCRCTITPVRKTLREMGIDSDAEGTRRRAADGGRLEGDTSFSAYFGRLSAAQQDQQFGPTRAKMFRDGRITVRDLVSGAGRELTLDELKTH